MAVELRDRLPSRGGPPDFSIILRAMVDRYVKEAYDG